LAPGLKAACLLLRNGGGDEKILLYNAVDLRRANVHGAITIIALYREAKTHDRIVTLERERCSQ
jgi:hypothetical protein